MNIIKQPFNSTKFANLAQTTMFAVSIETALKAAGRPTFIYMDKNADKETKKFSATKELLYQVLCLGIYLTILPSFKNFGFKFFQKRVKSFKGTGIEIFQDIKKNKAANIKGKHAYEVFLEHFKTLDAPDANMKKIKGAVEVSSIIGSIIGLTIIAPQISHFIIHPIMNALGFEKHDTPKPDAASSQPLGPTKDKVNVNA